MKLVNYEEFIRMPQGTVFCRYIPCCFHLPIEIKTDTGYEFNGKYLFNGTLPLEPFFANPNEFPDCEGEYEVEFTTCDNSSIDYNENELYAIFETSEIQSMIDALEWAKNINSGGSK